MAAEPLPEFVVVSAPSEPHPITLAQAKDHLNLDTGYTAKDARILELIKMAREYAERFTGRTLVATTFDAKFDRWPCGDTIELPRRPVSSVTSVSYYDVDGVLQVLASTDYFTAVGENDGRVVMKPSASWPTLEDGRPHAVIARYVAGYANAAAVPEKICQAIRLLVGDGFAAGEQYVTGTIMTPLLLTADRLLGPFRQKTVLV